MLSGRGGDEPVGSQLGGGRPERWEENLRTKKLRWNSAPSREQRTEQGAVSCAPAPVPDSGSREPAAGGGGRRGQPKEGGSRVPAPAWEGDGRTGQ